VYDTLQITVSKDASRTFGTCAAPAPSAGPRFQGSPGVRNRTCALAETGFLAFFTPGRAVPPLPDWSFAPVAYSLIASSRLGFSPKMAYHRAYHITIRKRESNTNYCYRQKICGLTARGPAGSPDPIRSPVGAALCPAEEAAANCRFGSFRLPSFFYHFQYPKRTNYMPNLTFPLPSPVSISPQSPSEPCGALAVQPCLVPGPSSSQPSIPLAASQPEKSASAPPTPSPSARCPVKGCVFPVSSPGHNQCRYHALLQSEAELFQSHQPSHLLSLQAPFGIPEEEPDDSRYQDRKRQAAEREAFILDEAA